jgi:hypothetical protein
MVSFLHHCGANLDAVCHVSLSLTCLLSVSAASSSALALLYCFLLICPGRAASASRPISLSRRALCARRFCCFSLVLIRPRQTLNNGVYNGWGALHFAADAGTNTCFSLFNLTMLIHACLTVLAPLAGG